MYHGGGSRKSRATEMKAELRMKRINARADAIIDETDELAKELHGVYQGDWIAFVEALPDHASQRELQAIFKEALAKVEERT